MEGNVHVDGIYCGGILMEEADSPTQIYSRESFDTSSTTTKPFLFGPINFTGVFINVSFLVAIRLT